MFNQDEIMHAAHMKAKDNLRERHLIPFPDAVKHEMKKVLKEEGYERLMHLV